MFRKYMRHCRNRECNRVIWIDVNMKKVLCSTCRLSNIIKKHSKRDELALKIMKLAKENKQ